MENLRKLLGKEIRYSEWNVPMADVGAYSRIADPGGRFLEIFSTHGKNSENAMKNANRRKDQKRQTLQKQKAHAKSFEDLFAELYCKQDTEMAEAVESGKLRRVKSLTALDGMEVQPETVPEDQQAAQKEQPQTAAIPEE
jgi:hypothetical protein